MAAHNARITPEDLRGEKSIQFIMLKERAQPSQQKEDDFEQKGHE